jgi:LysR family glycine cleavage system transcriptional activator
MAQPTRRRLPPLNALRAFEAVARSLSFTKAADQLLVTQSAVSRQVKNLEDILGVQLLKRKGPLELTEEGRKLLPVLTGSFDKIAEVIAGIKATHANPAPHFVAAADLRAAHGDAAPRRFPAQASDLEIRIDTPPSNIEFATAPVDMAIFFGSNTVDALIVDLLMREEITAICSPRLAAGAGNDLAQFIRSRPLLHVRQGEDLYQCWSIFAAQSGLEEMPVDRGIVLETADLVIESAINDSGVGMLDPRLIPEELKSGRLVTPFKTAVKSGRSYFLVSRAEEIEIPRIAAFRAVGDRAVREGELGAQHAAATSVTLACGAPSDRELMGVSALN